MGNSRGVRIPKPILEQCGLEGDVELVIEEDGLKIRPCRQVRRDWDSAFALMAESEPLHLGDVAIERLSWAGPLIEKRCEVDPAGTITDLGAGYQRRSLRCQPDAGTLGA